MSDNALERKMTALVEAQTLVRLLAEPCPAGDSVKAQIGRASRRVGLGFNRVRSFWYADERCAVSADELDTLRRAAGARKQNDQAIADDLEKRLDVVERMLFAMAQQDQEFVSEMLHSLRSSVGVLRRPHHAEG